MTKPPELKLLDFNKMKTEDEKPPEILMEKLQLMNDKAKAGKLKNVVLHFDYENDEGETEGGTMLWHRENNALELLGLSEVVKSAALQFAFDVMHSESPCEEE